MAGRVGSAPSPIPPKAAPPAAPAPMPTPATQPIAHSATLAGTPAKVGNVDSYSLSLQTGIAQKPPHEVGTRVHGSLPRLQYQHASAGVTRTQGDGTPGVHHQQLNAHATLASATHDRTSHLGPVQVHTEGKATLFEAQAEAGVRVNTQLTHPQAIVHGRAQAQSGAQAAVTGHVGSAHLNASLQLNTQATAQASAEASAVFDPRAGSVFAKAGVSATAGASASAGGSAQVGPLILAGNVGASAGVGYSAAVSAGMRNGVLGAKVDVGAALGIGAKASVGAGYDTTWRPHVPAWAHGPSHPKLHRLNQLGPQSAQAAAQAVAQQPRPQLQRLGPISPQGAQAAAQAVAQHGAAVP